MYVNNNDYNKRVLASISLRGDIAKDILDKLEPESSTLNLRWQLDVYDPKNIRIIYVVENPFTPLEIYVKSLSTYLTGNSKTITKEDLNERGILIIPFSFFKVKDTIEEKTFWERECSDLADQVLGDIIKYTTDYHPRERVPILIMENNFNPDQNVGCISLRNLTVAHFIDLGVYIDNEIPETEVPIKLEGLYYFNAAIKRDPKTINRFIKHIQKKL